MACSIVVAMQGSAMISLKVYVSGRVQGVFYRATAVQRARELGIRGYARNLPDGRVEVAAHGPRAAVDAFVDWLWTGSSGSHVTGVDAQPHTFADDQVPPDFTTG